MNINNFIIEQGRNILAHVYEVDHLTFAMVHALDTKDNHIPNWYKTRRVGKIIDYLITERIITRNQVRYCFNLSYHPVSIISDLGSETYQLSNFTIFDLSLGELAIVSRILPSEDIKAKISFAVSQPYSLEEDKNKQLQKYRLYCKL